MTNSAPKDPLQCRQFFLAPGLPRHRQYEALRAYYVDEVSAEEAAKQYGYTIASFRALCHEFRHDPNPEFFVSPRRGPKERPKKDAARELLIALRKQNYTVYEISEALKEKSIALSPTAVREVLKDEGFAPLTRRTREDRPEFPFPTIEAVADARAFTLSPREFTTRCGGLFLFVPDLIRLDVETIAKEAHLPGSRLIPAEHALRSCLAVKLWSIERKSHVMSLVADEGMALFSGLNVIPKKSYLSEYSSRIDHKMTTKTLAAWNTRMAGDDLFSGSSFNLDFHSVPYFGEHEVVESHYVSMRSRSQPTVLVFLAQDAEGRAFCYSNADLRKGEEADEILHFISFWKRTRKELPKHLVFDSKLTTYANLAKIDDMHIPFITLRRRSRTLLDEIKLLPLSAWRTIELDVPARKYKTPRVHEETVQLEGRNFRQLFVLDLGHDEPTILLTNEWHKPAKQLITRYAQRMLIENSLSDAVRFFHMNALSSAVGLKVDFDMSLLVLASGLYRLLAKRMRGYSNAQARQIFRDLIDIPADVSISEAGVTVNLHRRAHLPVVLSSGLMNTPISVPWWGGAPLQIISQ